MSGTKEKPEEKTVGHAEVAAALKEFATSRLKSTAPGVSILKIKYPNGEVALKATDINPCCGHGGEPIPPEGFRGGGQDIPAGHQHGYGGHSSQSATSKEDERNEKSLAKLKDAAEFGAKLFQQGLAEGKELAQVQPPEEKPEPKNKLERFLNKAIVIAFVILLGFAVHHYFFSSDGKKVDTEPASETQSTTGEDSEPAQGSFAPDSQGDNPLNGEHAEWEGSPEIEDEVEKTPTQVSDEELEKALLTLIDYRDNLRMLPSKIAGENKFVVLASIVTLPSGLSDEDERQRIIAASRVTGEALVNSDIRQKARNLAIIAEHRAQNEKPESFHWWANVYSSTTVPSANKTVFSKQAAENMWRIKQILDKKGTSADKLLADV